METQLNNEPSKVLSFLDDNVLVQRQQSFPSRLPSKKKKKLLMHMHHVVIIIDCCQREYLSLLFNAHTMTGSFVYTQYPSLYLRLSVAPCFYVQTHMIIVDIKAAASGVHICDLILA